MRILRFVIKPAQTLSLFLQKLFENAYIREPEVHGLFHWAKSLWKAFLVKGLGMIPIIDDEVDDLSQRNGAFELLRVRLRLLRSVHLCTLYPRPYFRYETDSQKRTPKEDTVTLMSKFDWDLRLIPKIVGQYFAPCM